MQPGIVRLCSVACLSLALAACRAQPRPDAGLARAASGHPACHGPTESTDERGRKRGIATRTATPPALDGAREELWSRAPRYDVAALSPEQSRPAPDDFSVRFSPMWDAGHLYLFVEITDDVKKAFDRVRPPHHYDQCEIYVFAGTGYQDRPKWNYGGPQQFAYEAFRAPVYFKPSWKQKQTDHRLAVADHETGWNAEIALPFAFWEFEPGPGRSLGFELHCNDGDAGDERDNHLAWSDDANEAWRNPSVIGTLTLCE